MQWNNFVYQLKFRAFECQRILALIIGVEVNKLLKLMSDNGLYRSALKITYKAKKICV